MKETGVISDLDQLKAMSDPLRVNIVRALGDKPMTTSQVARKLGLKPNRLYYHITELERVGLLEVVETRQKGNLLEKYYQPVARLFRIDPCIFQDGIAGQQAYLTTARSNFDNTVMDIGRSISEGLLSSKEMDRALNIYLDYTLSLKDSVAISEEFRQILEKWKQKAENSGDERKTHLTLMLYTKVNKAKEDRGSDDER